MKKCLPHFLSGLIGLCIFQLGFWLSGYKYPTERSVELLGFVVLSAYFSFLGIIIAILYKLK